MRPIILYAFPLVLAACATPQERCIAVASKDMRVVQALIAESEANLARGYAIGQETNTQLKYGFCTQQGVMTTCMTETSQTVDKPVAIDLVAERKKLASLRAKLPELEHRAVAGSRQCQIDYP